MAQLERVRHGDSESTIIHEPKKLTTNASPTMEHYLRGGEVLRSSSASSSPSSTSPVGHHDQEDDHGHHHKKSVLAKVKEKAKKLKHSLSHKKKHSEGESGDNTTPTWGGSMNEHEDEEQDAEYLGAPMYESEQAPEAYKETAKLHPRAVPVISEKHVLPSSVHPGSEQDKGKPPSPNKKVTETAVLKPLHTNETVTTTVAPKPPSPSKPSEIAKPPSPKKTITETVAEKWRPAYATVSDTTYAIASKIENLTVSAPTTVSDATHAIASKVGLTAAAPTNLETNKTPALQNSLSQKAPRTSAALETPQPLSAPAAPQSGKHAGSTFTSDKGVSVKEYLAQKFEPGEDERALSQVISDAMSPRRTPGSSDVGMVGKVKGAITSLLRNEESPTSTTSQSAMPSSPHARSAMTSSPRIPVSTNAYEVVEEDNKGRVLQTN